MNHRKKIDKLLEKKYQMNSRLASIEGKMNFATDKKPSFYKRFKPALICGLASLIIGIGSGIGIGVAINSNSNSSQNNYNKTESEYIKNALELISSECDSYLPTPLYTFYLNAVASLFIYKGEILSVEKEVLYFYQIVYYSNFQQTINLTFNDTKIVYINDNNSLGKINDDDFVLSDTLQIVVEIDSKTVLNTDFSI